MIPKLAHSLVLVAAVGLGTWGCRGTPAPATTPSVPLPPPDALSEEVSEPSSRPLPWEVWKDLSLLARWPPGDQVLLTSSYCPSGCRYDRQGPGHPRRLRRDGNEEVIFEAAGPGAITRLWMTTGEGRSAPLPDDVRLRVYLDRSATPAVDLPLPEVFAGTSSPFLSPMVADRETSSGGNVSYVPIPFRHGCRMTLEGLGDTLLWYQVGYHRLAPGSAPARGVRSFTGSVGTAEGLGELAAWKALLESAGNDPWPATPAQQWQAGVARLLPGQEEVLATFSGPDLLTGLELDAPRQALEGLELIVRFDGRETVRATLADLFAAGRSPGPGYRSAEPPVPARSLLVGHDGTGRLYNYFPMPFQARAEVLLRNFAGGEGPGRPRVVIWRLRREGREPAPGSGHFGVQVFPERVEDGTVAPVASRTDIWQGEAPLVFLKGRGKWVGLFAELGAVGSRNREYLEGDERIWVDQPQVQKGEPTEPDLHGTGTEDLFNGGFYFDRGPFALPLHGSPYHLLAPAPGAAEDRRTAGVEDVTAAYRLFLTDALPFSSSLRASLEAGPTGERPLRARTVAFYYLLP